MPHNAIICKAFDKGWNAGAGDRPRRECPFAPFSQEEKWAAWMIGYEESYERYAIADTLPKGEDRADGLRAKQRVAR